jgi:hypothetical protein
VQYSWSYPIGVKTSAGTLYEGAGINAPMLESSSRSFQGYAVDTVLDAFDKPRGIGSC